MTDNFITRICSIGRNTRLPLGEKQCRRRQLPCRFKQLPFLLLTMEAV
ncbi:hypothetical protein [Eisenbergiella massiliensis]|nr:hypothetical protein [Eisenbergiella massiliensis]